VEAPSRSSLLNSAKHAAASAPLTKGLMGRTWSKIHAAGVAGLRASGISAIGGAELSVRGQENYTLAPRDLLFHVKQQYPGVAANSGAESRH
jgi:hypothetical protein